MGKHIYSTAASNGKRVQALTEAKNHALVLRDAIIERTAQGIINSFCGCAGERCMALPVVVVENAMADKLVEAVTRHAKQINLGPAYDKHTGLGPVINQGHKEFVLDWIETAIKEGAKLILDGRNRRFRRDARRASLSAPRSSTMLPRICPAAARRSSVRCCASSAWIASRKVCR